MISARPQFDVALVREVIARHGLDPVPQGEPSALSSEDGSRLTVEVYSWGRVFFAEARGRGLGCTWVELANGDRPELPPWARTLRERAEPPPCFGWWRPVRECDGKGTTTSPPCFWRGRCVALQRRALRRVNVVDVELDEATFGAKVDAARASVTWADLDADAARRPPPPAPPIRALQEIAPEQEARERERAELARYLTRRVSELGGWEMVETRFRCSVGRCFVTESWFGRGAQIRRYLSFYLRFPPGKTRRAFRTGVTMGVFRALVGLKGITVRIWTASPDPVAAHLPADMPVRSVKKDRARFSVSVSVSDHEQADAVARAIVYVVEADLLTSRGSVERMVGVSYMRNGNPTWRMSAYRRGRR